MQPTERENKLLSTKPRVLSTKYCAGMQEQETKHMVTIQLQKKNIINPQDFQRQEVKMWFLQTQPSPRPTHRQGDEMPFL